MLLLDTVEHNAVVCLVMEFAICMLEGGNQVAQAAFKTALIERPGALVALDQRIRRGMAAVKVRRKMVKARARSRRRSIGSLAAATGGGAAGGEVADGQLAAIAGLEYLSTNPVQVDLVYRLLQLFCEGHNKVGRCRLLTPSA